jgi:hypothetical protein
MRRSRFSLIIIPILVLTFSACNQVASPFAASPSDVVKHEYSACNDGKYSEAESLFSADLQKVLHGELGAAAGGIKKECENATHRGTLTQVEIVSETIKGEGATVIANIHFKDGSQKKNDENSLIKENGSWKLIAN